MSAVSLVDASDPASTTNSPATTAATARATNGATRARRELVSISGVGVVDACSDSVTGRTPGYGGELPVRHGGRSSAFAGRIKNGRHGIGRAAPA